MRALLLAPLLVVLVSCATPITATNVGADRVYAGITTNALTDGSPSMATKVALHRASLTELYADSPREGLVALHNAALEIDGRDRLFALAELSYLTAREESDTSLYLASTVYAYLFLAGNDPQPAPSRMDRRIRVACDIYNRSLAEAFRSEDGDRFVPDMGVFDLPVGSIRIESADQVMRLGRQTFMEFHPVADYEVRGMTARIMTPGIGCALIAGVPPGVETSSGDAAGGSVIAGTAFLDVVGELPDATTGELKARLTLHAALDESTVDIRGTTVPLESDITVPIAYMLRESKMWDFELGGFLSPDEAEFETGLRLIEPYQPGKIPVVFVHGTASSPARWAEMLNELRADRGLRDRYQYWLFSYTTSLPILKSADSLRESLRERIEELDPDGSDAALRKMVVIGHSQGGLLTRLLVTEAGDRFWARVSDVPPEDMDLKPHELELIRRAVFFEPCPFVDRVIFVATPHQGSFLSEGILRSIANSLITLPRKTMEFTRDVTVRNPLLFKRDVLDGQATAVDNMAPGNPFLVALANSPMPDRVHKHSIIAVEGDGPLEEEDDGVVAYTSAQLDGVDSEFVVHSFHSCQDKAPAIAEVRRILREALEK